MAKPIKRKTISVDKVKVTLRQRTTNSKIGKGSSIINVKNGKLKGVVSLPVKIKVSMKQRSNNSNVAMHQGGSIKIKEV